MSWQKWISAVLLALFALYAGICLALYQWGASALPADLSPARAAYPATLRHQVRLAEGIPATPLPRLSPLTVVPMLLATRDGRRRAGLRALSLAPRMPGLPVHGGRRHAAGVALMIHVSRHWSTDDVIATLLAKSYFGRSSHGIDDAARAWYGLPLSQLRDEETLALVLLIRSPAIYDPLCRRDRFDARYRRVAALVGYADAEAALRLARMRLRPATPACDADGMRRSDATPPLLMESHGTSA